MTVQPTQDNELNMIQFVKQHNSHVLLYLAQQDKLHKSQQQVTQAAGYQYYVHTMFDFKEDYQ